MAGRPSILAKILATKSAEVAERRGQDPVTVYLDSIRFVRK